MSNIEKLKYQLQLQIQVKELLQRGFVDLKDPYHYEVIIAILNKPKLQKSANDLQLLSLAFTSIKFFNEMSKTTSQDELCQLYKELTYTRLPARRTVFHYGDIGKNFYIILRGSVWVLVAKAGLSDGQYDKQEKQSKKDKEVREQRDEGTIEDENDFCDNTDEEMLASKYPGMMKVGQVETEGSFGEIALTNFIPRQATIVCREDTHFIKLSREAFNKFLSEYYNRIQAKNFQFLKSINVFSDWPDAELSQIQYHMEPLEYSMNSVIYKEFEIIKGVYFVLEGQIEISESLQVKGQRSVFRQSSQLIQKKNLSIKLHRLGPGQLFGYQELIIGSDSRSTRAVCISEKSKVLFLAADRFKLYCIHNSNTNEKLILMVQQQEQIKQKATNIMLTNESFSLNANMSAEEKRLITNESIDHSIFKSESKRVSVKNQDTISPIGHRSQKLQSYYKFIQSKTSQNKDVKPLSFDSPLFEVNGGGRRITYERASQKSLHPQQLDSKQYLIEKLRLPKIFKKQKSNMNSDVQLVISKYRKNSERYTKPK
ncbi:Cyclic nucleotide-binding domain-containing protein 2 [Paramecium bursaria]